MGACLDYAFNENWVQIEKIKKAKVAKSVRQIDSSQIHKSVSEIPCKIDYENPSFPFVQPFA